MANKYSEFLEGFLKLKKPSEATLKRAKQVLDKTSDIFYNTDKDSPLTDEEWDGLLRHYKKFAKYTAGAKPKQNKRLVDVGHIFPELVGTLAKTNFVFKVDRTVKDTDTAEEWFDRTGISGSTKLRVAISDKKDGNAVAITFNDKDTSQLALTRGKDGEGADLTNLFKDVKTGLKIPKGETVGVKYEAIVNDENFQKVSEIMGKTFANARSMTAGILNSSDGYKYAQYISLVPIRVQFKNNPISREEELKLVQRMASKSSVSLNFDIIEGTKREVLKKIKELYNDYIDNRRNKLDHPIDGLVIEILNQDIRDRLGRDEDQNNYDFALKFPYMVKKSTVKGMRFDYGKTARITPVVKFEPVIFNGAECTNVSLANYKRFKELNLKVGDSIFVEYRNDVLAYVTKDPASKVEGEPIKFINKCPKCGEKLKLTKTKVFAYCGNEHCEGKLSGRIENWFTKLNIKGVKSSTIQKIIDADLVNSIPDLYEIKKEDLLKVDGFKDRSAQIIIDAIHSKMEIYDWELLGSLSFKDAGRKTFKLVFKEMSLDGLLDSFNDNYNSLVKKLTAIRGIESITANNIIDGITDNEDVINKLRQILKIKSIKDDIAKNSTGKSYSIVFTGFRDPDMQNQLESKGHNVKGSVSSNTNILVIKDKSKGGSKLKKAEELGVKVYSLDEFKSKIINTL